MWISRHSSSEHSHNSLVTDIFANTQELNGFIISSIITDLEFGLVRMVEMDIKNDLPDVIERGK